MKILGFDPSLRNWGFASMEFSKDGKLFCLDSGVLCAPEVTTKLPQNQQDVNAATYLYKEAKKLVYKADIVVAEYPHGSQNSRSMCSYGICMGVIGSLSHLKPIYRVTPWEVKGVTGNKAALKEDVIDWVSTKHPEMKWPVHKNHGELFISKTKAEHMADAVCAVHAFIGSEQFKQLNSLKETT